MAATAQLQLYLNTDFDFLFTIYNAAGTQIVDTSSWAISWIVKAYPQDTNASAVLTKTTSSGITFTGTFNSVPATNTQKVDVNVTDSDTTAIIPGMYFWELKRTDAGLESILALGQIEILASSHGN